jgi:thiosulfate reductase/polysulfide reductase chain A
MAKSSVYSVCGMCTVRCPIEVQVENGKVAFIGETPTCPP